MFIHGKIPVCMHGVWCLHALDLSDGCTNSNQRTRCYNYITYIYTTEDMGCACVADGSVVNVYTGRYCNEQQTGHVTFTIGCIALCLGALSTQCISLQHN